MKNGNGIDLNSEIYTYNQFALHNYYGAKKEI